MPTGHKTSQTFQVSLRLGSSSKMLLSVVHFPPHFMISIQPPAEPLNEAAISLQCWEVLNRNISNLPAGACIIPSSTPTAFDYTGMGLQDKDNQIMFYGLISRAESQQAYIVSQIESIVIEEVFRHKWPFCHHHGDKYPPQ